MAYTIADMEDTFLAALEPMRTTHAVRVIKTYGSELDTEPEIKKAVKLFPSIYAVYGGSRYEVHGSRKVERMRFIFFACDRSHRQEEEPRRGGAGNPGTYALLNGMRDLLCGSQLSLEIHPAELLREEMVWVGAGISVYAAEYETAQAHLYTGS